MFSRKNGMKFLHCVSHISLSCKWLNSSWTRLGKMRNADSWNVMKNWTIKPWELQGCRWISRKTETTGQTLLGTLSPALASASLSVMSPFSFTGDRLLLHGKKHCCQHFLSSISWNFYHGWWIKLHFLWWKGRFCYLNWEILSLSRPIYCSLGQGEWSYIQTWTFSQNHLVWLGEEHFQKDGSKVYRKRYIGQIK